MLEAVDEATRAASSTAPGSASPAVGAVTIEALADWLAPHHQRLLRFAYLVSGDQHAAEDLVQTAFVNAFQAGVRIEASTAAYFRRTIVNIWRSGIKRRRMESQAWTRSAPPNTESPPEDPDPLWAQILALPTQQRAVLALRYYEDMTERETAEVLGISVGSVKKHASRAIEQLRRQEEERS